MIHIENVPNNWNEQAQRVQEFMNYYIMNVMQEYDPELDQLLFYLPLAGSAFKKIYFDFVGTCCRACCRVCKVPFIKWSSHFFSPVKRSKFTGLCPHKSLIQGSMLI